MTSQCVCHISTVHTTFDQRIFHRQCWSSQLAGYDTHLVIEAASDTVVDGVQIHSIEPPPGNKIGMHVGRRIRRLWKANQIAKEINADIYHLHDPELIPLGLWLKLTTRAKVIFDCHENNVAYIQQKTHLPKQLSKYLLIPAMAFAERCAARRLDAVVTADQAVTEVFERQYKGKRTALVHNFPRLDLFLPESHQNSSHQNNGNQNSSDQNGSDQNGSDQNGSDQVKNEWPEVDLVYHGTIPKYHLEVAFEIAEILRQRNRKVSWLFFGKLGVSEKWIESEIKRRGFEDSFLVDPNRIPHQEVAARVRKARIGFIPLPDLPKFQYNIPTKLFEFMALKMPTVLSDLPPSRPFVGDGRAAIMVSPHDYNAYADAIEKLLDNPQLRKEMGEHGNRLVTEKFNWNVESQQLIDLYDTLLEA